jgi:hypothetical protein
LVVQQADITFYLTGGSGNTNPNFSLGGAISTTAMSAGLNSLFDNISGTDHAAGDTDSAAASDYRVIAIKVASPLADSSSSTLTSALLNIISATLGDSNHLIKGYTPALVNSQMTDNGGVGHDDTIAPTDPSNGSPTYTDLQTGINLPATISPGDIVYVSIQRSINAGSTPLQASMTLNVQGNTA